MQLLPKPSYLLINLIISSLLVLACQQPKRGYSENELQALITLNKQVQNADYEMTADVFALAEGINGVYVIGSPIPDAFQTLNIKSAPLLGKLQLLPLASDYIKFVDTLALHCDGTVEYVQYGKKHQITQKELFEQGKWRPDKLSMCGRLFIPEGHRLLILPRHGTHFQDLEIQTSPESFFSLSTPAAEYVGTAPKISIATPSTFKLYFL